MAILDKNRNDNKEFFVKSSNIATSTVYSDLDLEFTGLNLDTASSHKEAAILKDIEAVKQSVKNLVLTNFFERPFHPEIGGNVTAKLFEPADIFTAIDIKTEITNVLTKFEPRITNLGVQVFDNSDSNEYMVTIAFTVIYLQIGTEVSFNLQRLR